MRIPATFLFLPAALCILLVTSSCFHKDVMEDRADDVSTAFICERPEGNLIVVKEAIFQATSKKSGGGITQISGYNEFRLSAYNIESGELMGRVELGEGIEEECLVIGYVAGKIWCYSVDEDLGFHSRSLPGLETDQTEAQLASTSPFSGFAFARPEWSRLGDFYRTDETGTGILISDMQGNTFRYDPSAGTLGPYIQPENLHIWPSQSLSANAELSSNVSIGFKGDGREMPTWKGEIQQTSFSFLHPQYILEQDPLQIRPLRMAILGQVESQVKQLSDSIAALKLRFPGVDDEGAKYWEFPEPKRLARDQIVDLKYNLEDLNRDLQHAWTLTGFLDHFPLRADSTSLFVIHAANIADTAGLLISRMDVRGKQFSLSWTRSLPGLFYNPSAADAQGAFETVFSKGDPDFDYHWFSIRNGLLLCIYQLEMVALDTGTGEIRWRRPL